MIDLADRGFDAGLRYGHLLAKDMASVEIFGASTAVLVATPSYLDEHPALFAPADLTNHDTVVCRSRTTGLVSSWLLESGERSYRHDPERPTIAGDLATQIKLTLGGHGMSCTPIQCVAAEMEAERLTRVLPDWSAPLQPIHLYYPRRSTTNAPLQAFIAYLSRPSSTS